MLCFLGEQGQLDLSEYLFVIGRSLRFFEEPDGRFVTGFLGCGVLRKGPACAGQAEGDGSAGAQPVS